MKMDNYYDTIQVLSIHNINQYRPVRVTLEGIDIKIRNDCRNKNQRTSF